MRSDSGKLAVEIEAGFSSSMSRIKKELRVSKGNTYWIEICQFWQAPAAKIPPCPQAQSGLCCSLPAVFGVLRPGCPAEPSQGHTSQQHLGILSVIRLVHL